MRFLMMLALAGASVAMQADQGALPIPLTRSAENGTAASERIISLAVIAGPDVEKPLVDRVVRETEAIWSAAGITIGWDRTTARSGAQIVVTIDDEAPGSSEEHGPLGWIPFTPSGPEPSIHLSRTRAEILCGQRPSILDRTIVGHRLLIGRALGRALSHELGHYLFQSKMHTSQGLMRATWPSDELFAMDRTGFELTADQRIEAQDRLTALLGTTADSQGDTEGIPSATDSGTLSVDSGHATRARRRVRPADLAGATRF